MKKYILTITVILSFTFFGCFLDNPGTNNGPDGGNIPTDVPHNTMLGGLNHHNTSKCSNCHGSKPVTCDSCHAGDNSCNTCH